MLFENKPEDNTVTFTVGGQLPEAILKLSATGFVYKGRLIEDAGEARKIFMEVMELMKSNLCMESTPPVAAQKEEAPPAFSFGGVSNTGYFRVRPLGEQTTESLLQTVSSRYSLEIEAHWAGKSVEVGSDAFELDELNRCRAELDRRGIPYPRTLAELPPETAP